MAIDLLPKPIIVRPDSEPAPTEIRELTAEEVDGYVRPEFESRGYPLPNPAMSTHVGIVDNGKVVGFLTLQVKLHAQPVSIDQAHRHMFAALCSKAEEVILQKIGPQWVYLFAPAGHMSQLAQSMGMQLEPWCVLSKFVQHETPESKLDPVKWEAPDVPVEGIIQ
jgi:hypothetical protein